MGRLSRFIHFYTNPDRGSRPKPPEPTYETLTGKIISFIAQRVDAIKSLIVGIEPQQDLHGYDTPWPPGGGKNLLKPYASGTTNTQSGMTGTANADGSITFNGTTTGTFWGIGNSPTFLLKAGSYVLSQSEVVGISINLVKVSSGGDTVIVSVGTTLSGTFTIVEDCTVYFYTRINSGVTLSNKKMYFWLESGSSASAWTPYSNICPISGHTGATVQRTGKNLFDKSTGIQLEPNNLRLARNQGYGIPFKLLGGVTYTFSCNSDTPAYIYIMIPFTPDAIAQSGAKATSFTYTPTDDIEVGLNFWWDTGRPSDATDFMIELGSTASDYEPFSGTSVSLTFGQTVYGGQAEDNGDGTWTVVATQASLTKNTADMNNNQDYPGWTNSGIKTLIGSGVNGGVTGAFTNVSKVTDYYGTGGISANTTGNNDVLILNKGLFNKTQTDWIALAIDIQIVIALAEPITFTVSGEHLTTLVGNNNVWASTGDVTATVQTN